MPTITLTNGGEAQIDQEDKDLLVYRWRRDADGYVRGYGYDYQRLLLHRIVFSRMFSHIPHGTTPDHKNLDKLDNRRDNLRSATNAQQQQNTPVRGAIGFKGVKYSYSKRNPYRATITVGGQRLDLGRFPSAEIAAHAYDQAAALHFGEFARLNFPSLEVCNANSSS